MCGRFVIKSPLMDIVEYFEVHDVRTEDRGPRFNVAPSTQIPLIRDTGDARTLDAAWWGFVPRWAKTLDSGRRPINARCETVAESRLFGPAYQQRRCLIPADGYYEWKALGGRRKQPYYIHPADGEMLAFGAIWEPWHEGDPDGITTTAIITTPANAAAEALHDRMPLMVQRENWEEWLLGDDPSDLLRPPADDLLTWHPVDSSVGNPRNENEHLIDPIATDEDE